MLRPMQESVFRTMVYLAVRELSGVADAAMGVSISPPDRSRRGVPVPNGKRPRLREFPPAQLAATIMVRLRTVREAVMGGVGRGPPTLVRSPGVALCPPLDLRRPAKGFLSDVVVQFGPVGPSSRAAQHGRD
jgi:hypothetical protein